MPWQEVSKVEERQRFVARMLAGEGMCSVCREFGISRKTGHKIWNLYQRDGVAVLNCKYGSRKRRWRRWISAHVRSRS